MSYLLDTNILGRLVQKAHPMHPGTVAAVRKLRRAKETLCMRLFSLRLDSPSIYAKWERLVKQHKVMGKPGHDARLVAAMLTHGITHLLTYNTGDFKRYGDIITIIDPKDV